MIRVWQDFDPNCRICWGLWFGSLSRDGHVIDLTGPHQTQDEARQALDEQNLDNPSDIHR